MTARTTSTMSAVPERPKKPPVDSLGVGLLTFTSTVEGVGVLPPPPPDPPPYWATATGARRRLSARSASVVCLTSTASRVPVAARERHDERDDDHGQHDQHDEGR